MSEIHDVVIVGSGPAGYTAAIYAARAQLSPILYEASALSEKMRTLEIANPIFYLLDAWSQVMVYAEAPSSASILISVAWASLIFIVGTYFFLTRERDFAVRL